MREANLAASNSGHGSSEVPEAGTQLLELIRLQLNAETELKQSLESRAITVITTSGAFVTVLLAFITWSTQQRKSALTVDAKSLLATGVASLLLAALAGIGVNAPYRKEKISARSLVGLVQGPLWNTPGAEAQREITRAQLMVLISAGSQNKRKSRFLMLSICAQLLGLSLVASAALEILL